jgi:hypothetical protein
MGIMEITENLSSISRGNNHYIQTFLSICDDTFKDCPNTSVWCSGTEFLTKDSRFIEKLVLSVVTDNRDVPIDSKLEIFKQSLSVDFDFDVRISKVPLKLPMLELYSTTDKSEFWLDNDVIPASLVGREIWVPLDYYLFKKPIFITSEQFDYKEDNIITDVDLLSSKLLPYMEVTTT